MIMEFLDQLEKAGYELIKKSREPRTDSNFFHVHMPNGTPRYFPIVYVKAKSPELEFPNCPQRVQYPRIEVHIDETSYGYCVHVREIRHRQDTLGYGLGIGEFDFNFNPIKNGEIVLESTLGKKKLSDK